MAIVPEPREPAAPWRAQLRKPIELTGNDLTDARLVGHSPTLTISEAGMTLGGEVSPVTGSAGPRVLRSQLTLTAANRKHASVASATFHVDRALARTLTAGDLLFMAGTTNGGLALSIIRDNRLIAAAGAVSAVPLGEIVRVGVPFDVVTQAEGIFRKRDPDFEFLEWPVEIRVGEDTRLQYRGRPRIQSYEFFVEHGVYPGLSGHRDECVAVSLRGVCPDVAAAASAQLMDRANALEVVRWPA